MKRFVVVTVCIVFVVSLSGCFRIRGMHPQKFDRVDQKIEGNRGYLKGTPPPPVDNTGRQREMMAIDIDLVTDESRPAEAETAEPALSQKAGTPVPESYAPAPSTEEDIK